MEHKSMFQLHTLPTILQVLQTSLHNTYHTLVRYVGTILITVTIVHLKSRLSTTTIRTILLNVNLLIANIEALKDNPAPSSDVMTKSSSTSPNLFLEETNTFDNSSPEPETFCFDLEEIGSGSTTTHADFSQYDSFIFDLSINPFPPADRSDFYHEEFADELAHIIC
ncbi:hypothetical protein Tco_0176086 [Tanacetum coccineum]